MAAQAFRRADFDAWSMAGGLLAWSGAGLPLTPDDGVVAWDDLVKGRIEIANAELDDLVLLRADGVPTYNFGVVVDDLETCPYYDGPCKRIAIFLSLFNVHVNRSPVSGTVYRIEYKPGAFKPAMKTEASELNESNTLYMDSDQGRVTVRQISGLVARRIVCAAEEGQNLELGQKFGMIKFGSRTELYLPPDSEICVTLGEKVKAGTSIVARFQ